jgi:long-chain acyl-CoA synthetase
VAERPDHLALAGASGRRSFAELDADSATVASTLYALGVRAGDRVAVSLPNDLAVVTALLGIWRLGAVYVGVHRALAPPEKAFFLDDSGASVLLGDPEVVAEVGKERTDRTALEHLVQVDSGGGEDEWGAFLAEHGGRCADADVDPLAVAAIAYTSGTTGRPKGVMHSQHNALLPGVVFVARGSFGPDEPIAVVHPLTILNLMVLNPLTTLAATSTCVLCDRHDAVSIAGRIRDEKVACISCVPTIFYELLTDPRVDPSDLATLTKPRTGGSAMSADLERLFTDRFGVRPATSYALTEGPTLVTRQDEGHDYPEGNLGPPLPHVEITIRDERAESSRRGRRARSASGRPRRGRGPASTGRCSAITAGPSSQPRACATGWCIRATSAAWRPTAASCWSIGGASSSSAVARTSTQPRSSGCSRSIPAWWTRVWSVGPSPAGARSWWRWSRWLMAPR